MAFLDDAFTRRDHRTSRSVRLLRLPALLLLGAVVLALLAAPVLGAGLAVRRASAVWLDLPSQLQLPQLAQRTRVLAADGSPVATFFSEDRTRIPLADVPRHVQDAVVAVEDADFYAHRGVDVRGMLRAGLRNVTSGTVEQGGSTLTQQYVKNALLASATTAEERRAATDTSYGRKLREARYAMYLESVMSKDEILQRYLNIAYFGQGAHGIAAAAHRYFGKEAGRLTVAEGALLVGLVQSPSRLDPVQNPEAATARRNLVLSRMVQVGVLPEAERARAASSALGLDVHPVRSGCAGPEIQAPFFCDYVRRALTDGTLGDVLGTSPAEREQRLFTGGLTIRTTLDPDLQATAQRVLAQRIPSTDASGVAAAFVEVEPGTGHVQAMAVNRRFGAGLPGYTRVNLPLGGSSGMQAGSTFKPFVLAAALEQGLPLSTTFDAPAEYTSDVFTTCEDGDCTVPYTVRNAGDSTAGRVDLVSGTQRSVNTFYLQLLERTGIEPAARVAEAFGLRRFAGGAPSAPLHRGASFVLGVDEVSPLAVAAAYAGFAAHGRYCPPVPVTEVLGPDGRPLPLATPGCRQAVSPEVADTVASILRGVVDQVPGRTARAASIGRPAAGKTGTTNGSTAAWFTGFTPHYAATVWMGTPVPTPLRGLTIGDQYYRQVYGGSLPAPVWADISREALADVPVAAMPPIARSRPEPPGPAREERRDRV